MGRSHPRTDLAVGLTGLQPPYTVWIIFWSLFHESSVAWIFLNPVHLTRRSSISSWKDKFRNKWRQTKTMFTCGLRCGDRGKRDEGRWHVDQCYDSSRWTRSQYIPGFWVYFSPIWHIWDVKKRVLLELKWNRWNWWTKYEQSFATSIASLYATGIRSIVRSRNLIPTWTESVQVLAYHPPSLGSCFHPLCPHVT